MAPRSHVPCGWEAFFACLQVHVTFAEGLNGSLLGKLYSVKSVSDRPVETLLIYHGGIHK